MRCPKIFISICTVIITLCASNNLCAQNLSGDTIFVNAEAEIMVRFPSLPQYFYTVPADAPYNFKTLGTGFTIIAKKDKTPPAPLLVGEGNRNHKFVVVFKKNINYNNDQEMDYDFSSTKKIEQHLKDLASAKQPKANGGGGGSTSNSANSFYGYLEAGDKSLKNEDFKNARTYYQKAQSLNPEDQLPKQRLEEVRLTEIAANKKDSDSKNASYVKVLAAANADISKKDFASAKANYQKALQLKPNDLYTQQQLEKLADLEKDAGKQAEKLKLNDVFAEYISIGDKAMKNGGYGEARIAYEQALIIKKGDQAATSKLKQAVTADDKRIAQASAETEYDSKVAQADEQMKAGLLEDALANYQMAYATKKQSAIKSKMDLVTKKIADQKKQDLAAKKEQKSGEEAVLLAQAEKENKYKDAIGKADKLFASKDYDKAYAAYKSALVLDNQKWPRDQMTKIDDIKIETKKQQDLAATENTKQAEKRKKQQEKDYKDLITRADKLFKKEDLEEASKLYAEATVLSEEAWPKNQIAVISAALDRKAKEENERKLLAIRQAQVQQQFDVLVKNASSAFSKKNYLQAQKLYTEAAVLLPSDKMPAQKIAEIKAEIASVEKAEIERKEKLLAEAANKKAFDLQMALAKSYLQKEDFVNANVAYDMALTLKPKDNDALSKQKSLNEKLIALTKINQVENKYDLQLREADSLLILKSYDLATKAYQKALDIKPDIRYPQSQISYIAGAIRDEKRYQEDLAKLEAYKKEEDGQLKYIAAMAKGKKAVAEKDYKVARDAYNEILSLRPDNEYALHMIKVIDFQSSKAPVEERSEPKSESKKERNKKPVETEGKVATRRTTTTTKRSRRISTNPETTVNDPANADIPMPAVAYTKEQLAEKYPGVDFSKLPPEQPFNADAINSNENAAGIKKTLSEAPRLNISDKDNKVALTCQSIYFDGDYVYVKMEIDNGSKDDFLTGAMMLTWNKKNGIKVKLFPVYLFPALLPVVAPDSKATVIYVCKSYYINDNDKLSFEMQDRTNKTKFELEISGKKYNQEEGRYFTVF